MATKQLTLRLEEDFHAQLYQVSKEKKRSLHSQILVILASYFDAQALRDRLAELERTP